MQIGDAVTCGSLSLASQKRAAVPLNLKLLSSATLLSICVDIWRTDGLAPPRQPAMGHAMTSRGSKVADTLTELCTLGAETCRLCLNFCVLWSQVMKFCYALGSIADGFQKIFRMGRVTAEFAGRRSRPLTATSQVPFTQCVCISLTVPCKVVLCPCTGLSDGFL